MTEDIKYSLELKSIVLCKFGHFKGSFPSNPDKKNTLEILPQLLNISLYESIFSPVLRAEISIGDHIGLFTNFPLTGEEVICLKFESVEKSGSREITTYLAIESFEHIQITDTTRESGYIIKAASIEVLANNKMKIQKGYLQKNIPHMVRDVFDEYIAKPTKEILGGYDKPAFVVDASDSKSQTIVIPNLNPFGAMRMLAEMAVHPDGTYHTYMFYQTLSSFKFETVQSMYRSRTAVTRASRNRYIYNAQDVMERSDSPLYNKGRLVSSLLINKRIDTKRKLQDGYYHNNLYEVNIAQKSVHSTVTKPDNITKIYSYPLNTEKFIESMAIKDGQDDQSNRTRYILSAQRENDENYPISDYRKRWGKDLISSISLSQNDITVVIPGTTKFSAGDLFALDIPIADGFTDNERNRVDDLLSGLYLISEIKHTLQPGGFHSCTMRLNRDSYPSKIDDKVSKYV